jgi:SAM-dependent methyltransferase
MQTEQQALSRPSEEYERDWLARILNTRPSSVLDVGCGEGKLLEEATRAGCERCMGIEIDERLVSACRNRNLDVRAGVAESLPFEDQSFDVVTLGYAAHHLENLDCAIAEAARVARRAVFILDPWYDLSIPSQQVALDFDDWLKNIDRRSGMVHGPCIPATRLMAPFQSMRGFRLDFSYRLILQSVPLSHMEALAQSRLERVADDARLQAELSQLLDRARLHGVSEDGAVTLCAQRVIV